MRTKLLLLSLAVVTWGGVARADGKSLCNGGERTVWSCHAGTKDYSLCASRDLGAREGYLQYRAGRLSRLDFQFPVKRIHPRGQFAFGLLPHGARLVFERGVYRYEITEDLKGDTSLLVRLPAGRMRFIDCTDATQTLTENTTIDLFKSAGLAE